MPQPLQHLLEELDHLLAVQSQALDELKNLPSPGTLSRIREYEVRIEDLLTEIGSINGLRPQN